MKPTRWFTGATRPSSGSPWSVSRHYCAGRVINGSISLPPVSVSARFVFQSPSSIQNQQSRWRTAAKAEAGVGRLDKVLDEAKGLDGNEHEG